MEIARKARRPMGPESLCLRGARICQRLVRTAMVLWLALLFISPGKAADAPAKAEEPKGAEVPGWRDVPDLVARLRRGGLVVYFRHATTDRSQKDQQPIDLSDCAKQRNLSNEGRRQSQAIGEAFRTLGIPVGPVLSSPFCRAIETSRLAFGRVEKSDGLYYALAVSAAEKSRAEGALRKMLSEPPPVGENRVVVSHTANLKDASGIWPKPEGAAIVFEPRGGNGFQAIARISPDEWSQIVAQARIPK